jgi:MFS family permease
VALALLHQRPETPGRSPQSNVRFLLGIAEAGFFPGVAYFMTCWFPALYRGRMMGIFYAAGAFAGVLSGPLGAAPLIVKSLGLSNIAISYLLVLPNLCRTIGMILFSRSSDRTGERIWHVVVPVAVSGLGAAAAGLLPGNITLTMAAFCVAVSGVASCLPVFWTCRRPILAPAPRQAASPSSTRSATYRGMRRRK